jgi:ArsR family transcriptional regulator
MTIPWISPLNGEPINHADAERLAGALKALADPARLRLLSLIQSAPGGTACPADLIAPLGLSQPTVSHHLRILSSAGLIEREKRGVWVFYRIVPTAMAGLAELLTPTWSARRRRRRALSEITNDGPH